MSYFVKTLSLVESCRATGDFTESKIHWIRSSDLLFEESCSLENLSPENFSPRKWFDWTFFWRKIVCEPFHGHYWIFFDQEKNLMIWLAALKRRENWMIDFNIWLLELPLWQYAYYSLYRTIWNANTFLNEQFPKNFSWETIFRLTIFVEPPIGRHMQ